MDTKISFVKTCNMVADLMAGDVFVDPANGKMSLVVEHPCDDGLWVMSLNTFQVGEVSYDDDEEVEIFKINEIVLK